MDVLHGIPREYGISGNDEPDEPQPWRRWQDWMNLLVGVWLWFCPGIFDSLGNSSTAESGTTTIVAGTIIAGASLWALAEPETQELEGINMLAGVWLILTPAMFGFTVADPIMAIAHWATGTIIAVLALWALIGNRRKSAA